MNISPMPNDSVILFGSGVSQWAPSNVPTGAQIRDALLSLLFSDQIEQWNRSGLRHWLNWIPFETINEFAPSSVSLDTFYSKLLSTTLPNNIHKQLVRLASAKYVHAMITTNYDCGIELASGPIPFIYPVIDLNMPMPSGAIPLFKIHGCTTRPNTLIYRLRQESVLPEKKTRYLHSLLMRRTLVVFGYSGIDFEVCPAIAASQAKQVLWCYKSGSLPREYETQGLKIIASKIPTQLIPIDMSEGLPWLPFQEALHMSPGRIIKTDIAAIVSEEDRAIWALRLACAIGYAELSQSLIKSLLSSSPSDCIVKECREKKGFALFHAGRYKNAGYTFIQNARIAQHNRDHDRIVLSFLDASDTWRVGGYYGRAVASFLRAKHAAVRPYSPKIACRLALKKALLIKSVVVGLQPKPGALILSKAVRSFVVKKVRHCGQQIVKFAKMQSISAGQVFDQKQLDELFRVFTFNPSIAASEGDGYEQLGYLSASTTQFRIGALKIPLSAVNEIEAEERFALMCLLGNHPEAWKVAIRMSAISSGISVGEWEKRTKEQLRYCQYRRRHRKRLISWIRDGAFIR